MSHAHQEKRWTNFKRKEKQHCYIVEGVTDEELTYSDEDKIAFVVAKEKWVERALISSISHNKN